MFDQIDKEYNSRGNILTNITDIPYYYMSSLKQLVRVKNNYPSNKIFTQKEFSKIKPKLDTLLNEIDKEIIECPYNITYFISMEGLVVAPITDLLQKDYYKESYNKFYKNVFFTKLGISESINKDKAYFVTASTYTPSLVRFTILYSMFKSMVCKEQKNDVNVFNKDYIQGCSLELKKDLEKLNEYFAYINEKIQEGIWKKIPIRDINPVKIVFDVINKGLYNMTYIYTYQHLMQPFLIQLILTDIYKTLYPLVFRLSEIIEEF